MTRTALSLLLLVFGSPVYAQGPAAAPAAKPAAGSDAGVAAEAPVPDPTLRTPQGRALQPEKVSARVRETLKRKMKSHSRDFQGLPLAIVLGNHAEVQRLTQGIMNEPRLDKAAAGDDLSGLSEYFFQLQNELRENATALNKAAGEKDVRAMTAGLGTLAQTCATCHAIYKEPMSPKK